MAISFDTIPANLRVPFVTAEFSAAKAAQGPALMAYRAIIIGQKLVAGTALANTLVRVTSVDQVITLAGRGSMLHRQAIKWFANNKITEVWIGVLDDNAAGVAATGTITVTGTATKAGTISLLMGGESVPVAVAAGEVQNTIATNIGAAINAKLDLPITASVATNVVTITFRHKGLAGNTFDVRHSYVDGESLPPGVTLAVAAMGSIVAGTLNPVLTTLLAAMDDFWFNILAHAYTDATSLAALEANLAIRFGPMRMQDGVAFTAAAGSFGTLTSLGGGRNSQHSSILGQPGVNPPNPPMEFAAAAAAVVARYGADDPARPFQTLTLNGILPPAEADLFSPDERNLLLFDGIATTKAVTGGVVQLERMITTYQTSPSGADDTAYLDVTTLLTLMYLRYSFRVRMQNKYPRHKLANDGTRFGPGQAVMTPKLGKSEAVSWFEDMEKLGLVEGLEQFETDLVVERSSDPNRLNFLLSPDLINQLIVTAAKVEFRL
jgi:phage tail sheath gpL-like